MGKHLLREIENLKKKIIALGVMVKNMIEKAMYSLEERNKELAEEVIEEDKKIDEKEVELEEECLKVLALYQPVAKDLRFIVAVMKINNDMERIGDLAVNIAERAAYLATQPKIEIPFDLKQMTKEATSMLKKSLDAFVNSDVMLALEVCKTDDVVDEYNREMFYCIQDEIRRDISKMELLIHILMISRHLERIADLATNIAEDVVYMVEGEIMRHKTEDFSKKEKRKIPKYSK